MIYYCLFCWCSAGKAQLGLQYCREGEASLARLQYSSKTSLASSIPTVGLSLTPSPLTTLGRGSLHGGGRERGLNPAPTGYISLTFIC